MRPGRAHSRVLTRNGPRLPVILSARRTAIGTAGHAFAGLTTTELAAPLLADAAAGIGGSVDDVILGNCMGAGGNVARIAALAAGLPESVSAVTIDRQCGSGLDAVLQAASRIGAGDAELILAGGVESASTAPWRFWPPKESGEPQRYSRAPFVPPGMPDPDMGPAADALAELLSISRARQDEYAARSHALAAMAVGNGTFDREILPVHGVSKDERPRTGLTVDRLARLPPAFGPDGTATAGNSSGISDGAAVLTVSSQANAYGRPAVVILGSAVAGADPALPGLAIEPAVRKLLTRKGIADRGISLGDVGAVELTEAFASIALAGIDALGLDVDRVCRHGGAIGLGHPWGASGAVLAVRLVWQMLAPDGPELGLAVCAIAGGQAVAMLFERVD